MFPAGAGMNRSRPVSARDFSSVPRRRGDEAIWEGGCLIHRRSKENRTCFGAVPQGEKRKVTGPPSNATAASTPSWVSSTKRTRKRRPHPDRDGSTIFSSGGQARGVVWVATLQRGSGSPRWRTGWRTLLAPTTPLSQRASPRCCGRGLAWKALLEAAWHGFPASAATTVAGRRLAWPRLLPAPHREGEEVEGATLGFSALVRHRAGVNGSP